jgi:hypothetical protein
MTQSRRNKAPGLFLDGSIFVCTTFDRLPFKSQSCRSEDEVFFN